MEIRRGDVLIVDFGLSRGSVQGGVRPAIVVQNDAGNKHSPTYTVVPLTGAEKKPLPVHGVIMPRHDNGISRRSTFLAEQTTLVDYSQVLDKVGRVTDDVMQEVGMALAIHQGLIPIVQKEGKSVCGQKDMRTISDRQERTLKPAVYLA